MKSFQKKKNYFLIKYKNRLSEEEYSDMFIEVSQLDLARTKTFKEFSQRLLNIGYYFKTPNAWAAWRLIVDEILQEEDLI